MPSRAIILAVIFVACSTSPPRPDAASSGTSASSSSSSSGAGGAGGATSSSSSGTGGGGGIGGMAGAGGEAGGKPTCNCALLNGGSLCTEDKDCPLLSKECEFCGPWMCVVVPDSRAKRCVLPQKP